MYLNKNLENFFHCIWIMIFIFFFLLENTNIFQSTEFYLIIEGLKFFYTQTPSNMILPLNKCFSYVNTTKSVASILWIIYDFCLKLRLI